jgi:hypothetical protein
MNRFIGLSLAAYLTTLAVLAPACSSSSSPAGGGGGGNTGFDSGGANTQPTDSGSVNATDTGASNSEDSGSTPPADGGSCTPSALPSGDGGVPAYTAPKLDQGVCSSTEISAFVTACSGSGSGCSAWAQSSSGTSSCGQCLFSSTSTIAPLELFSIGTSGYLLPSIGSCILASSGAGAASCAEAADEGDYCVNYVCAQCAAGTGDACVTAAQSGVCASQATQLQSACSTYASAVEACEKGQGTSASLTSAANAICGSGASDASDQ